MAAEPISITMICRTSKDTFDQTKAALKTRELTFFPVPGGLTRTTVEGNPTGSTDPNWPQIRVEYSK